MPTAVPTLGNTTFLTEPSQIIAYVLRHYGAAPRSVSSSFDDYMVSFTDTLSRYTGSDPTELVGSVKSDLTGVFSRLYPNEQMDISVSISQNITHPTWFNVVIEVILVVDGKKHMVDKTITVDKDGQIQFDFT